MGCLDMSMARLACLDGRTLAGMSLDPDDPRPPYVQVANALRDAVNGGTLRPGEKLPSGSDLAERYGAERPVGLRPHVERAFEQRPDVTIDFAGFSGETLLGVLQEPLDKVRAGDLPTQSIAIRALVPDLSAPLPLPCTVD